MAERSEGMDVPLESLVGRLAARWKVRAIALESSGAKLSGQFLRECAEEIEAALQQRDPNRTSWFAHEAEIERLRTVADAAAVYYEHYAQDEADDVEACVCGREQHERAAALRDALRALPPNARLSRGPEGDFGLKR